MTREKIKEIVYNICHEHIIDNDYWKTILSKSYDGEDLLLYSEIGIDLLDTFEIINKIENDFEIGVSDDLFNSTVTLRNIIDYIYNKVND